MMFFENAALLLACLCLKEYQVEGNRAAVVGSAPSNGIRGNQQVSRFGNQYIERELQLGADSNVNFDLYDAILDVKVGSLTNGTVVNLNSLGITSPTTLSIQAIVLGSIKPGSVKLSLDASLYNRIEGGAPYTLCGNKGLDFYTCTKLTLGAHTVQAIPYSGKNATGSILGSNYAVTFTIINTASSPVAISPVASPTTISPTKAPVSPTSAPGNPPNTPTFQPSMSPPTNCNIPKLNATWETWSPYPISIGESQGAMVGNYFFVVSGFTGSFSIVTQKVYGYDTTNPSATWVPFDDIPVPGFSHAAHAVDDLLMYICGSYVGPTPGPDSDICLRFSPTSPSGSQWSLLPNMPISRGGGGLVHIKATNSLLFSTGSTRRNGSTIDYQDTYEFDLTTQVWTKRADIPYKANHVSHVTATYQGKQRHYIMGGQVEQNEANGNQRDNFEWDAINKVWIKRADLVPGRGHASASTLAYGCGFLILGGAVNNGATRLKTNDVSYYAIDSDTWTKIGDLPKAMNSPVCGIVRLGAGDDWVYCQTGAVAGTFSWRTRISLG